MSGDKVKLGITQVGDGRWQIIMAGARTGYFTPTFATNGEALWRMGDLAKEVLEDNPKPLPDVDGVLGPVFLPTNMKAAQLVYHEGRLPL